MRFRHRCGGMVRHAIRRIVMLVATLALGMAFFALFFGLVAACDRL